MSVPVAPKPHRIRTPRQLPLAIPLASLVVVAAIGGAMIAAAPNAARTWVAGTVSAAWLWLAVTVVATALTARRLRGAAAEAHSELRSLQRQLAQTGAELTDLVNVTFPSVVKRLRDGDSAEDTIESMPTPSDPRLRRVLQVFATELGASERRSAGARAASAMALGRVQAKAVSMLADLREMQDRHGEEVLGDLLELDHDTSQLGLLTDRLALLMGGRASRPWNKPVGMESILRGAVGRIAAYQRVRVHSSSTATVAGFAAEGVMHLLAELMDNAANFSPPVDEVHVYVEERTGGLVVTVEDSGLKMADASMRRAEEAVSGRVADLAALQGAGLGLAVVGRLAAEYGMTVSFRPSARGGTGVVVLFPPQLLAQPRSTAPERTTGRPVLNERVATSGGLPVRPPGHTMAAADRGRTGPTAPDEIHDSPGRDPGAQFGAFHRSRKAPAGAGSHPPVRERRTGGTGR